MVICAIALSLAYPVREYIAQRQQIDQLLAQQQTMAAQVKALQAESGKLSQTWYIEQEARDSCTCASRRSSATRSSPASRRRRPSPSRRRRADPWYAKLWDSVQKADADTGQQMNLPEDAAVVAAQLGRPPRGLRAVAHRCPCGLPDVVETAPRLPDGTPFPTLYYLTCPRAAAAISGLEAAGLMREMTARLAADDELRAAYMRAHRDYLARRDAAAAAEGLEPLPPGTQSAGGMPDRVKCLHALAAHELAAPGTNPLGREALDAAGQWWSRGPCVTVAARSPRDQAGRRHRLRHEFHPVADRGHQSRSSERVPAAHPLALTDVTRQMRIVRLGEGVDRTGRLSAAALDRTMTALAEYAGLIADARPAAVRMVATSATRDAANAQEFTDRVCDILGVAPEVITGDEEAWLSFTGATRELAGTPLAAECPPPYLVTDIGGGSTEFVLGGPDAAASRQVPAARSRSVNIGCVRLTERHLHGDPPPASGDRGHDQGHRRRARPGRGRGARGEGEDARRPRRVGHDGRRDRARP